MFPYQISSNGTLTMKRSKMKEMSTEWLRSLYSKAVVSSVYGSGRLSKSTEKSLILELRSRGAI
jgi:hypothetical protein